MKILIKFLIVTSVALYANFVYAITYLYDSTGNVAAVLDTTDTGSNNVYLASTGDAVGYVDNSTGAVYSYSGKHLGWYSNGALWDNNGYMLAFVDTNIPKTVTSPLVKKEVVINRSAIVPAVTTPEVVTTPPTYVYQFSPTPLNRVFTVEPATNVTVEPAL